MSGTLRTLLLWMVIFVVVILLWNTFQVGKTTRHDLTYSEFNEQLNKGRIAKITLREQTITGTFKEGGQFAKDAEFKVELPFRPDSDFTDRLIGSKVEVLAELPKENTLLTILIGWAPVLLLVVDGTVAWVPGVTIDDRFRLRDESFPWVAEWIGNPGEGF